MAPYEIQSNQFGLVNGTQQPASDMILVAEPGALFAPEARKGRLYIVAETSQDVSRSHAACQTAMNVIRKVFYEDHTYSITSSLRKAIIAANKTLYDQNFNESSAKRAFVGVSCVVIKDQDIYIAQVQPTQTYLFADGKLRALPTHPSWNDGQHGAPALLAPGAIGSSLTIEPELYRAVIRPGDSIVLCSSNLARMLGRDQVLQLLRSPDTNDITAALLALCSSNALASAHGVAISVRARLSSAAQAAPLSRSGVSERGRAAVQDVGTWLGRMSGEVALLLRPGQREQHRKASARHDHAQREQAQLNQLQDEPPPVPAPQTLPLELGETIHDRVIQEQQARPALGRPQPRPDETAVPPSAFLGEGDHAAPAPPPAPRRVDLSDTAGMGAPRAQSRTANQPSASPTVGEQLLQPFSQFGGALTRYSRRRRMRRPPPTAMPAVRRRGGGLSYRRERPPFPWLLLVLLVLAVALFVVYGRGLMDKQARSEATDMLKQAEQAVAQVRDAPNDAAAQTALDAAAEKIALVKSNGVVTGTLEDQQSLASLERQYDTALTRIQKISYLDDVAEVARHPQASSGATWSSIVVPPAVSSITNTVGFESIYALDTNQGVLYRIPKAGGTPEPFLRPDTPALSNLPAGKVKAVAWREDNVVAVTQTDAGVFLYAFRTNDGWAFSNLNGSEGWNRAESSRLRLATYEGNLYFLNALPGQVLKFTSGLPANASDPWIKDFGTSKTEAATDLAVDGEIYLLQPDGRVQHFAANTFKQEIAPPNIRPPIAITTSFFVSGNSPTSGAIFLVETQQERIIQIDKETGAFVQQIKVRPDSPIKLDKLTAVYLDESGAEPTLYLANGGQLLKAALPPPPRAVREPNALTPVATPAATPAATVPVTSTVTP